MPGFQPRYRTLFLAATFLAALVCLLVFGPFAALLALAAGLAASVLVGRRQRAAIRRRRDVGWVPRVQHPEVPPPPEDPFIGWLENQAETAATETTPLPRVQLLPGLRGQLDSLALGRAKRIVEAPQIFEHAAADGESWAHVEQAVGAALALLERRHVRLAGAGRPRLSEALARCAVYGVLLAEWRQLEDGPTVWDGSTARVRASDAYTIHRLAEMVRRRLLPDLFAGIERRPSEFDVTLLVPFTIGEAFYLRLHGAPPKAVFAAA